LDTLWNTLEDTGTITKQDFLGTNLTNSIALVNCDFPGIKIEIAEEKYGSRNGTKSHRIPAKIDGKVPEDTREHQSKGEGHLDLS
jgi:hypothetical protein